MKKLGAAATALVGLLCLATAALADGLQRFQQEVLPKFPKDGLAYESAQPVGASGFLLTKVVVWDLQQGRPRAKADTLSIDKLVVEEIDFDRLALNETPHFARLRMEGATLSESQEFGALARSYGVNESVDVRFEYRFDPATRVLAVHRLEIVGPGVSRLLLEMVLDNVRSVAVADREQWMTGVALRSLKLTYEDRSALLEIVRALAKEMRRSQAAVIREWTATIAAMSLGKGPKTQAAADGLVSFVQDYRKPKGPVEIAIVPAKPLPIGGLAASVLGADPAQALGLSVSYAGTRAGAGAAAAALGK